MDLRFTEAEATRLIGYLKIASVSGKMSEISPGYTSIQPLSPFSDTIPLAMKRKRLTGKSDGISMSMG